MLYLIDLTILEGLLNRVFVVTINHARLAAFGHVLFLPTLSLKTVASEDINLRLGIRRLSTWLDEMALP